MMSEQARKVCTDLGAIRMVLRSEMPLTAEQREAVAAVLEDFEFLYLEMVRFVEA